jgi:hypothetical protein
MSFLVAWSILQFLFECINIPTLFTKNSLNCWDTTCGFITNFESICNERFSISLWLLAVSFFIIWHKVLVLFTDLLIIRSFSL